VGGGVAMTLDDVLFSETDDACAICGIRGPERLSIHHIDGNRANNIYENTIVLCHNCHHQHHQGKGLGADKIEERKRHLILKTLTQYGLNALKVADRNGFGVMAAPFLLYHLVNLGLMDKGETEQSYIPDEMSGGEIEVLVVFTITQRGKELLKRWFP
jgi:hypothetical protein